MNKSKSQNIDIFILFLISPFIALISVFRSGNIRMIENVIWAFIAYFAFNIDLSYQTEFDIYRYAIEFNQLANTFNKVDLFTYLFKVNQNPDFLNSFITYVISLFTNNSRIFLLIYGIIFGFFYSRNFGLLFRLVNFEENNIKFFLIVFALIVPISSLGGFRYWTGTEMCFYAIIPNLFFNKKPNFIILTLAVMLHYGIALIVFAFFVAKFFRKFRGVAYILFVFFFFNANLFTPYIEETSKSLDLGEKANAKAKLYTSEIAKEQLQKTFESTNWYVESSTSILYYSLCFYCMLFFWKIKKLNLTETEINSYIILLIMYIFGFIASTQMSGGRIISFIQLLQVTFMVSIFRKTNFDVFINWIIKIMKWVLIVFIIVQIRVLTDYIGFSTLFGSVIFRLFVGSEYRIIDFVKIFIPSL